VFPQRVCKAPTRIHKALPMKPSILMLLNTFWNTCASDDLPCPSWASLLFPLGLLGPSLAHQSSLQASSRIPKGSTRRTQGPPRILQGFSRTLQGSPRTPKALPRTPRDPQGSPNDSTSHPSRTPQGPANDLHGLAHEAFHFDDSYCILGHLDPRGNLLAPPGLSLALLDSS